MEHSLTESLGFHPWSLTMISCCCIVCTIGLTSATTSLQTLCFATGMIIYISEQCEVDEWSDWSECTPTTPCSLEVHQAFSYSLPVETWDSGRLWMGRMMKEKEGKQEYERQCSRDGSCPEFMSIKSSGPKMCHKGQLFTLLCGI